MSTPPPLFEALLARAKQLYSLPAVAMEVLQLTSSDQVDLAALRATVQRDPALVARLLRAVNSPLFRVGTPVGNLGQALTLLGIQPLKLLVLSFSLPRNLCSGEGEALGAYWRRTLAKAIAARHIAGWFHAPPEEAFLAGLLQDLGVLVLFKEFGTPYGRLLSTLAGRAGRLGAAETTLFGFAHTTLSARLLAQWQLPELLVRTVAMPQQCDAVLSLKEPLRPLVMTLHLAELCAELVIAPTAETAGELTVVGRKYIGLKREQLEPLLARLREELPSLAEMLRVPSVNDPGYDHLLAEAHERLSALQDDVLPHLPRPELDEEAVLADTQDLAAAVARLARPETPLSRPRPAEADAPPSGSAASAPPEPADVVTLAAERLARAQPAADPHTATTSPDVLPAATDAKLVTRLAAQLAGCRARRTPCSLLLVEAELIAADDDSPAEGGQTMQAAAVRFLAFVRGKGETTVAIDQGRVALILPDCERPAALDIARQWQQQAGESEEEGPQIGLRCGIATARVIGRNFRPAELIAAAYRCLLAAGHAGGADIKSIEL